MGLRLRLSYLCQRALRGVALARVRYRRRRPVVHWCLGYLLRPLRRGAVPAVLHRASRES
jgi:hypothetical protein